HRIDILVSGRGSLLPPLLEAVDKGEIPACIGQVISDRPNAPALDWARKAGLKTLCLDRREYGPKAGGERGGELGGEGCDGPEGVEVLGSPGWGKGTLSDAVLENVRGRADLLVLAGFLSILEGELLEEFAGRIINIHPALLPLHGGKGMYGMRVHEAVIKGRDGYSGCTVHYVTEGVDRGPVILQRAVAVLPEETAESLQEKVHLIEGETLVEAIRMVLEGEKREGEADT
ncbi:MAG: phosphoribosylglycinamide formyltransferase, partial [Spirochaetaceae bacterium]